MESLDLNVVTGAFGYTGKYITRRLLSMGKRVKTLTGHPDRENPFGDGIEIAPLNFDDPSGIVQNLRGASTLYNTYWIRFARRDLTFEKAVQNSRILVDAAREARLSRIVHISITNPTEDSPLPYFSGKARVEKAVLESGLSYAIIRPTVIFGPEGILINNIAYILRRFPYFAVFGRGDYRVQPVYVEDLAELAAAAGEGVENVTMDAVGPEVFTFEELVRLIAEAIGKKAKIVHMSPGAALLLSRVIGLFVRDVVVTPEEIEGLMSDLLVSDAPPTCRTRLSDWLGQNADSIGVRYASELRRHYR